MRFSVIIAAHNEGDSLWRTVESSIEGLPGARDYEIVVADDASDDGSVEEMLRRFPHVRVVRHEQRRGASPTKDLGARQATGEVLVFLDGHAKPEPGAIVRLVEDVDQLEGKAVVTPTIQALDVARWQNIPSQVGHGYRLELERFDCGWLSLCELRAVQERGRRFYESPALIGCALAVTRELYDELWGFDPHMRFWGVEDLDFGLKCWLMGFAILHDPEAVIGHRFRERFDNYDVPIEHLVVNQLRMAHKNFTQSVWSEWAERCRARHPGGLAGDPQGLWSRIWQLFEAERKSVEHERSYLMARRVRDEFWYAERFGLRWPRLELAGFAAAGPAPGAVALDPSPSPTPSPSPSPSPPPCEVTGINPASVTICVGVDQQFTAQGTSLDGVAWSTSPAGTPGTGSGATFTTQWSSPGSKTVTASCAGTSEDSAVTVVAVDRVIVDGSSPENLGPEKVCVGSSITLRAMPDPAGASFPGGQPVWNILSQPAGSTVADPPAGSPTATITPTHAGTYSLEAKCGTSSDAFQINASAVDLVIYNGLAGYSGGQEISHDDEESVGAVTVVNMNDTDGDGTNDRDDTDVSVSGSNPPGRNEIDLMKVVLKKPVPDDGGNVTLTVVSGDIKLWESSTKGTEVSLTNGKVEYPTSQLDKTLWVEARSVSSSLRDIVLEMEYQGCKDTVKATGVWVTKTARSPWHTRQIADGFPDNPEPGPGKDLPDLTDQTLIDLINKSYENGQHVGYRAADGSRYGFGTMQEEDGGGDDEWIGGRILYEFEVAPSGAENLGVVFDVTRQVQMRYYRITNGSGALSDQASEDFPWLQTPVKDNELPNDDIRAKDEQNTPVNRHLYSFDGPATSIPAGSSAFYIIRATYKEWVRVQVNNTSFPAWPASQEQVRGSRASHKYEWHLLLYVRRDSSGKWVEDNDNPSYNVPVFTGTGNGTIGVTLLENAVTEGFTATYDLASLKWTLDGTSSDPVSDEKQSAPQGTQWTLTVTAKVQVVITQGSTAFADGDEFKFSVFKSTATGGKKNEIDEGYIDATDGP